jgi:hypothetical protein
VAEAECATCHHIRAKTEMREVAVSRVVGRAFSSGQSSRTGFRNSSSQNYRGQPRTSSSNSQGKGSSSRGTTRTRVDRLWVCVGCKAPKSDGWLLNRLIVSVVCAALIYFGAIYVLNAAGLTIRRPIQPQAQAEPQSPSSPKKFPNSDAPTKHAKVRQVEFAPPSEVVQPIPFSNANYPQCSATVTDHCASE